MLKGGTAERRNSSVLLKKIGREIEAHKRTVSGRQNWPYLNNFHCRLPGGIYREIAAELGEGATCRDRRASRKLRSMTYAQFYRVIDELIAELGLDAREIQRLQSVRSREIYDYAFPLYVRLRAEGFRHYPDLTS